jgi:hypothetical protein
VADADETFMRLQVTYLGILGVEVGIFVAVDHLRRADLLTEQEEETYFDVDDWFRSELPNPPFYDDGNTIGAVTWFKKSTSAEMIQRLSALRRILDRHHVEHHLVEITDPGDIVYEDDFQVGVVPYRRLAPTPAPEGTVFGPTSAGSKRHLGKRARAGRASSTERAPMNGRESLCS